MAAQKCPLVYHDKDEIVMTTSRLKEIEDHISTSNSIGCFHPPLKKLELIFKGDLQKGPLKGSTPLLMACHDGELDSVKHILENWGVDVQTGATYYVNSKVKPSGSKSPESSTEPNKVVVCAIQATPLFVASCNGHFQIVQYLVEKGANISARTSSEADPKFNGLTPLYGAVCDFRSQQPKKSLTERDKRHAIVRLLLESGADPSVANRPSDGYPIWRKKWCAADATTLLINHGLDLSQRDPKGSKKTILHHWCSRSSWCSKCCCGPEGIITEEETLVIVKLLINKGVDLTAPDSEGFTPILCAAAGGTTKGPPNFDCLDFLLKRDEISRLDKINAMELAGALILSDEKDPKCLLNHDIAFEYWRKALQLRQMETDSAIEKIPLNIKSINTIEWVTSAQLEHVIQHPSEYLIQSLLVELRIYSGLKRENFNFLLWGYLKSRCDQRGQLHRAIEFLNVFLAILEICLRFDDWGFSQRTKIWAIERLASVLLHLLKHSPELLNIKTIQTSFDLILGTVIRIPLTSKPKFTSSDATLWGVMIYSKLGLVEIIVSFFPQMLNNEDTAKTLWQLIRHDFHLIPQDYKRSLLNEAIKKSREMFINNDSCLAVIRFLLQAGEDPNTSMNEHGDAPLHILAMLKGSGKRKLRLRNWSQEKQQLFDPIAHLLLDFGAHLDRVNKNGKTAADVWIETKKRSRWPRRWRIKHLDWELKGDEIGETSGIPEWLQETFPKLTCLSAKIIRFHKVPYLKKLPKSLCRFVEMH